MKRIACLILVSVLMIAMLPVSVFAAENSEITYFEDGSYIVVTISENYSRSTVSKNGSKSYVYHNSTGTSCWKATLNGTFTYTGSSSTCTASSCSVTVYESDWSTSSKSATKSGNTAKASVTMVRKALGVTVDTKSASISLTCDTNGNLS